MAVRYGDFILVLVIFSSSNTIHCHRIKMSKYLFVLILYTTKAV